MGVYIIHYSRNTGTLSDVRYHIWHGGLHTVHERKIKITPEKGTISEGENRLELEMLTDYSRACLRLRRYMYIHVVVRLLHCER